MSLPTKTIVASALIAVAVAGLGGSRFSAGIDTTELVTIAGGSFAYRQSGEFLREGSPVNAPLVTVSFDRPLALMKHQVSRAEYERCVAAGACKAVAGLPTPADNSLPAVGVNWHDATNYAAWLSSETGYRYRLPTDIEWAYAAGGLFRDNLVVDSDGDAASPATRWIATYESEAQAGEALDPAPKPFGTFGQTENGLQDIAGNVWEWTDTCYSRRAAASGRGTTVTESCGVRVVEGRHRAYASDFVRDPRGGGCSAGTPPSNLGIRLVREEAGVLDRIAMAARRLLPGS